MAFQHSVTQEIVFQLKFARQRLHSYKTHPCKLSLSKEALPHYKQQSGKLTVDVCRHYNMWHNIGTIRYSKNAFMTTGSSCSRSRRSHALFYLVGMA